MKKIGRSSQRPSRELIDTLWNVNTEEFSEDVQTETGINRYIMECK